MRLEKTSALALLGLLRDAPHHGYELHHHLSDPAGLGQVWRLGISQLYADLKTLEASGLISATLQTQAARPAKKVFALTDAGRAMFAKWMVTPSRGLREMRIEFIVRLYFARSDGAPAVAALVARQDQSLSAELARLLRAPDAPGEFDRLVRTFRINQIRAARKWLQSIPTANPRPRTTAKARRAQTR